MGEYNKHFRVMPVKALNCRARQKDFKTSKMWGPTSSCWEYPKTFLLHINKLPQNESKGIRFLLEVIVITSMLFWEYFCYKIGHSFNAFAANRSRIKERARLGIIVYNYYHILGITVYNTIIT